MRITYVPLTEKNVEQLRMLTHLNLPMQYKDSFFATLVGSKSVATYFASVDGVFAGAVSVRLDAASEGYLMILAVLRHYRRCGIARGLLQHVRAEHSLDVLHAHVQEGNDAAIAFYRALEFEFGELDPDYYRKLEVKAAYPLVRRFA